MGHHTLMQSLLSVRRSLTPHFLWEVSPQNHTSFVSVYPKVIDVSMLSLMVVSP